MNLPVKTGEAHIKPWWLEEWRQHYGPWVDEEIREAIQWAKDNPHKRKSLRGARAFLGNWLRRAARDRKNNNRPPREYQEQRQRTTKTVELQRFIVFALGNEGSPPKLEKHCNAALFDAGESPLDTAPLGWKPSSAVVEAVLNRLRQRIEG